MVLLHSIENSVVAEKVSVDCRVLASNSSSVQWKDPASPSSCLSRIRLKAPSGVFHVSTLPPTVHCTATLSPGHAGWLDVTATGMVATEDRQANNNSLLRIYYCEMEIHLKWLHVRKDQVYVVDNKICYFYTYFINNF